MLYDDILLNIFQQYLEATPRLWPILIHVCRRWKQVLLGSPLSLQLRLYCTHGTPVLKTLDCWPPLPLVLNYGGMPMLKPPASEDEDNIIGALMQSDRVKSISLTVTILLLGKLSTISELFWELEELFLISQDSLQLTLPSTFRWGSCLRTLHVTRIAVLSLPPLLSSSTDLVDLQLHEIPTTGYFSPQVLASVLSGASHLRSLSLHFHSFPPHQNYDLPNSHPIVLPVLTCFKYRGISKYLNNFVARIDTPHLRDIDITFFSQPTMDTWQLGQFIERTELQMTLTEAKMKISAHSISISFRNLIISTCLQLRISCRQLDWQLSSMAQVCDQLAPFLSGVNHLSFNSNDFSSEQGDVDGEQWLQLVRPFSHTKTLSIAGKLAIGLLCALRLPEGGHTPDATVLPALRTLRIRKPMPLDWPFWDAARSLISSRALSFRPMESELQVLCPICKTSIMPQQVRLHLVAQHAYKWVCSHCDDFKVRYILDFQAHLRNKHPEVAQNDKSLRSSKLTPFQVGPLASLHLDLHSSLHPPP